MKAALHVAVGVIKNALGEVLISLRPSTVHQGDLWEFPGGKVEAGESVEQALERELYEELAIQVEKASPLINIHHDYTDLSVNLDVWWVEKFSGIAHGREGQPIQWVLPDKLIDFAFPEANKPIISAVRLPPYYAILDDEDEQSLLTRLDNLLGQGVTLIQARLKSFTLQQAAEFFVHAQPLCRAKGARLLVNSGVEGFEKLDADGVHLTSRHLMALTQKPPFKGWIAASCHNPVELLQAQKLGLDFAVLAPVLPTPTHPMTPSLGWQKFHEWVNPINIPVYALGGVSRESLDEARKMGGQGISGIRTFLS
ncbi:Nudix family hydrolase [Methylicorpusculum oleiharenae]|uniref:Nudix family hydrolase n=1 Tax=Methylicorpusculum oleiharenae TaxID=1338687 RepID=UPI0013567FB2|nr:Nudix family hydrolase [Methylicorpusculum oleiharenae]MCD2450354.1 Nudix family hydrolase [Methylicorpusculum oleiharenae]